MASHQYFFGGKYDLIQLHRQIIHQNAGISMRSWLKSSPTALFIYNLKKTTKMTWNFVISAVWAGTVFCSRLWSLWPPKQLLTLPSLLQKILWPQSRATSKGYFKELFERSWLLIKGNEGIETKESQTRCLLVLVVVSLVYSRPLRPNDLPP